jgi:pimeloyl-ACP methyl ester carboxylesterase
MSAGRAGSTAPGPDGDVHVGRRECPLQPPAPVGDDCTARLAANLPAYRADPLFPGGVGETTVSCTASARTFQAMVGYDFTSSLSTLRVPVLSVYGLGDAFEPARWDEVTRSTFASADLEIARLPACGHMWDECPAATEAVVGRFFDGVLGPKD